MTIESCFTRAWYRKFGWTHVFQPIQPLVRYFVANKRQNFLQGKTAIYRAPVPVVVVGNISVGGTGKSPMVVALCELLTARGYKVGIISRGHGATLSKPQKVSADSLAEVVGDEPVMLARRTQCPMVVFPERKKAIELLLEEHTLDVIISDDGMQHYALDRDIEIAMIDAQRGLGNEQLLPVGPLREPKNRLNEVDFVVSIAQQQTASLRALSQPVCVMPLTSDCLYSLDGKRQLACETAFLEPRQWHVMAGIGNPERFKQTLTDKGLDEAMCTYQWFSDHHGFKASDIPSDKAVIMTEKDAVKCQALALNNSNIWYLPISLALPDDFKKAFIAKLNSIKVEVTHE